MSLDRLAAVELQLIMQHCDLQSLLMLARCSHQTLAAASHPFAWRALSLFSFSSTQLERAASAALAGSLPLRFCDVALQWSMRDADSDCDEAATAFRLIESISRVRTLDLLCLRDIRLDHWRQLLAHPAVHSLTALRTDAGALSPDGDHDGALIPLLVAHCPLLQRLHVHQADDLLRRQELVALTSPLLPHLTDLLLGSLSPFPLDGGLNLAWCASLRRLHLINATDRVARALLASTALQQLESLTLQCVRILAFGGHDSDEEEDWSVCFANLRALQSLSVYHCSGIDKLLSALLDSDMRHPRLCSLRVRPRRPTSSGNMPSPGLLSRLLDQLPSLTVQLQLVPVPVGHGGKAANGASESSLWHSFLAPWTALQRDHPARIVLAELQPSDRDPDPFLSWLSADSSDE
jgi:hypothetical protein